MNLDNQHQHHPPNRSSNGLRYSLGSSIPAKRARTPNVSDTLSATRDPSADRDPGALDDGKERIMKELYARSERLIAGLFSSSQPTFGRAVDAQSSNDASTPHLDSKPSAQTKPAKRPARAIDEDDYGDDEDDDDNEAPPPKSARRDINDTPTSARGRTPSRPPAFSSSRHGDRLGLSSSQSHNKSPEEVRKALEEEQKAAEKGAKDSFLHIFYTLENDRDAMLEQQKLDELDRQVENEMSGPNATSNGPKQVMGPQQGTLSSANLGASSLALKHLIARVDMKRDLVKASDAKLRSLMKEVRKNRSKWANEDRVGQEELYEAAERVLMDLKSQTEYAAPFLQRVNRRDAPDYHKIISKPMDIGTMIKKLKGLEYKSKKEFVDDLELIWANCLKYNADPAHFLRKKAEHMRKETARLTPLIPDITIRDRAEVEAAEKAAEKAAEREERERKRQLGDIDSDEDDQPIVATRGRKAPSKKGMKGGSSARKAPSAADENQSPAPDARSSVPAQPSMASGVRGDHLRPDGEGAPDGGQHGFSTPPPGTSTPLGALVHADSAVDGSHADASELEGMTASALEHHEELDEEDEDYKTWKHVTKKERAHIASDRHRLFAQDRLNAEEPALLRTKAGMRRWMRQQRKLMGEQDTEDKAQEETQDLTSEGNGPATGTLAEGMDVDDESALPDYYFPLSGVPEINPRLKWTEDNEGQVIDHREECLRLADASQFSSNESSLTLKIEANMRQMQETRKIMAKIGMVKQMQVQTQTYQNQFQKYEPEPFREAVIPPTVTADNGPIMAPGLTRATLQRSVAKLFYHAGFEDFQPSALDSITEMASHHFEHMANALKVYYEAPKIPARESISENTSPSAEVVDHEDAVADSNETKWKPRFTAEEAVLHTLQMNGHDLDGLTSYIEEDVTRLGTKLAAHHENVRQFFADLVRPALDPTQVAYDGGASAFNDGSESQFVAGDFAEDIDEDFFGFKEMGLDKEFGISASSVPLHLLQSRINALQPTVGVGVTTTTELLENPPQWQPVTLESIESEIGLVQQFFRDKLDKTDGAPLIEDEDLPAKQRFPKPRLPPTGKISSPRKRPLREQQMMARKKRRLEIEAEREREREKEESAGVGGDPSTANGTAPNSAVPNSAVDKNNSNDQAALTNGVAVNGTATQEGDHEMDVSPSKQPSTKAANKTKLEPPKEKGGTNTDPEKKSKSKVDDQDNDGDRERDDSAMMGQESMPIAAH